MYSRSVCKLTDNKRAGRKVPTCYVGIAPPSDEPPEAGDGAGLQWWSVTRRSIGAESRNPTVAGPESCHGARYSYAKASEYGGGYGTCFCIHSGNFVELEPFRGTRLIGSR
jgi:hypothetical protein